MNDSTQVIILDCNRGRRRLDQTKSLPNSLSNLDDQSTVLDWIYQFTLQNDLKNITYIGGYQIQKVIQSYPQFNFLYHQTWNTSGETSGLALFENQTESDLILIRASTVLLPETYPKISTSLKEICIGGNFLESDYSEFAGIMYVPNKLCNKFLNQVNTLSIHKPKSQLEDLIENLRNTLPCTSINLNTLVAPLDRPVYLAQTIFQGKAKTLEQVRHVLKSATVLEQYKFSYFDWLDNSENIIQSISEKFADSHIIVRSSSAAEDNAQVSNAGLFKTVQGISADNKIQIEQAVSEVFSSYEAVNNKTMTTDEIFVQEYKSNLTANGVIFTRDLESAAPYMLINIDRNPGSTDGVTSGSGKNIETIYINKKLLQRVHKYNDEHVQKCVALVQELEIQTNLSDLDIEFGIDDSKELYLFQLRPISTKARKYILEDEDLYEQLDNIQQFIHSLSDSDQVSAGNSVLLGTMSDWNPVEMLGTTPRPLALSLYQRLIGQRSWAKSRAELGYMDMQGKQLIQSLGGIPYVNIKLSLNSFLPSTLSNDTANKWINHCLNNLQKNPELHDKIEFELTPTCYDFNFSRYTSNMKNAGLTEDDIADFKNALITITNDMISEQSIDLSQELDSLNSLGAILETWSINQKPQSITQLSNKISDLLFACETHGTLIFAKLARCAFVSIAILKSLVNNGCISESELGKIYKSIPTIASNMTADIASYQNGTLSLEHFLEKYGHLRPSSYDITSDNYKNGHLKYFTRILSEPAVGINTNGLETENILNSYSIILQEQIEQSGLNTTPQQLISFITHSIQARELAKFEFMKLVNEILESITELGQLIGFSRDDLSYLSIHEFEKLAAESPSPAIKSELIRIKQYQEKKWNLTCHTKLPHLISADTNISYFKLLKSEPNYISDSRITAIPVILDESRSNPSLAGKIIMISSADPGYDWIFSHSISGLITEHGGAASHMSIRAAEFGIPAAIGCGPDIYNKLKSYATIELDCVNKTVKGI